MKLSMITIAIACAVSTGGWVGSSFAANDLRPLPMQDKADKIETFKGKVEAVDATAKTLTVGGKVFQIAADTKLTKAGKTITLAEIAVGEQVNGLAKYAPDGKAVATTVMVVPSAG